MGKKFIIAGLLAGLVAAALCIPQAKAAIMAIGLEELTEQSDVIITGTVINKESKKDPETTIYTINTIAVQEVIKGNLTEKQVQVKTWGGEIGEIGLRASTEPVLNLNEKVVLFLSAPQDGVRRTVNLLEGKYTVADDGMVLEKGVSIDDFKKEIKGLIK